MNITSCSKNASVRNAVVYIIKERKYIFKFKANIKIPTFQLNFAQEVIESREVSKQRSILFTKIYVPSETKDVNLNVFNMITKTNEVKTLVKHIAYYF